MVTAASPSSGSDSQDRPSPVTNLGPNSSGTSPITSITIQNIGSMVPIKLTTTNYLTWSALFAPIFRRYNLTGIIDGSVPAPPQFLHDSSGDAIFNPNYVAWFENDQNILIWINSTLSDSMIPYTVGVNSSRELWSKFESRLSTASQSHVHELRSRLRTITNGDFTAATYLQQIEEIVDALTSAGAPIEESELLFVILHGLPSDYDSFVDAIQFHLGSTTIDELHGLLLSKEIQLVNHKKSNASGSFQAFNSSLGSYAGILPLPPQYPTLRCLSLRISLISIRIKVVVKIVLSIRISQTLSPTTSVRITPTVINGTIIRETIRGTIVVVDLLLISLDAYSLAKFVAKMIMRLLSVLIA